MKVLSENSAVTITIGGIIALGITVWVGARYVGDLEASIDTLEDRILRLENPPHELTASYVNQRHNRQNVEQMEEVKHMVEDVRKDLEEIKAEQRSESDIHHHHMSK